MSDVSRRRVVVAAVFAAILVAAALATWIGGVDLWLLMSLSAAPWLLLAWGRFGGPAGGGMTILAALGIVLAGMMITALVGIPLLPTFSAFAIAFGLGGAIVAARTVPSGTIDLRRMLAATGPLLGAIVWAVVVIATRIVPGANAWGWVMNNDSANNLLFARLDLAAQGIRVGSEENPVPLPAGMLALGMSPGRAGVDSAHLLAHDLSAFIVVWGGTIALLCVIVGVVVSSMVDASRPRARWIAGALASFFPLSWFVAGYPIEYGFLSSHVALVVVFACWLVFRHGSSRPAIAWAILALGCTLLLAVWSPLVLFPAALMLVVVTRSVRSLWAVPRRERVLAIAGTAQLLLYGIFVSAPGFFAQSGYLAKGGAVYAFSRWMFIGLVVAAIVAALIARRRMGPLTFWGLLAAAAAAAAGFGALVYAASGAPDPTTNYYPLKLEWVAGVILSVLLLGVAVGLVTRWWSTRIATAIALVLLTFLSVAFLQVAPLNKTSYVRTNPVPRILAGDFYGPHDQVARLILRFADQSAPTIYWRSGRPEESQVNFWVMQVQANSLTDGLALRKAAYGLYDVDKVADLCDIVKLMNAPVRVVSADAGLAAEVSARCPEADLRVVNGLP